MNEKLQNDRQALLDARKQGPGATLRTYARLSGPGWLQAAITLGGGSLSGALLLGALGGVSMLWLQLLAITCGVIMLSAISYVTLSSELRPLQAINQHINPVLGWGWVLATILANIIWVLPQFGLAFDAFEKNLLPEVVGEQNKFFFSMLILAFATLIVYLNASHGRAGKLFDLFLKILVAIAIACFFAVVVLLSLEGTVNWSAIVNGLIPDWSQWNSPAGELIAQLDRCPQEFRDYWSQQIVTKQRSIMIGAAATAVGINMTFLLPYSLLRRGWDRTFRGLARFDLFAALAIPYLLVTGCIVIAADAAFHASIDEQLASNEPAEIASSPGFQAAQGIFKQRIEFQYGADVFQGIESSIAEADQDSLSDAQLAAQAAALRTAIAEEVAELPEAERILAVSLVKRGAFELSATLAPVLGNSIARIVFGLGVAAMAISTIIILMLINGMVFVELFGKPDNRTLFMLGCLVSGVAGVFWPVVWAGESRFWLTIMASVFGMMLLPIAYTTFFFMMNSRTILKQEKPTGWRMAVWNVLMLFAVAGAIVAAGSAIYTKATDRDQPMAFYLVSGIAIIYLICVFIGFLVRLRTRRGEGGS